MSNDKTITETLPMTYKGWRIEQNKDFFAVVKSFRVIYYQIGNEYESRFYGSSIEEAKELIDERN